MITIKNISPLILICIRKVKPNRNKDYAGLTTMYKSRFNFLQFMDVKWEKKKLPECDNLPLNTFLHEMLHALEFSLGLDSPHSKRFYRVLKYLKKEYGIK